MLFSNSRKNFNKIIGSNLRNTCLASFFLLASTIVSFAADIVSPPAVPSDFQDQQRWRIIFSPYVWGASLDGNAGLLGLSSDVHMPFREIVNNLDMSFMGNIEVGNGTFGAYFDGQYTKTSQGKDIYNNRLGLNITATTLSGGVYYRIYEQNLNGNTLFGNQRIFAIEPTVGVRWTKLKAGLDIHRYNISRTESWTDPFIGSRILYDLNERWNIAAEADIGGFGLGTKLSANGQIYFGYRTLMLDMPVIWRVGYRSFYQNYNDGTGFEKFKYKVNQHGPVIGLSVVF